MKRTMMLTIGMFAVLMLAVVWTGCEAMPASADAASVPMSAETADVTAVAVAETVVAVPAADASGETQVPSAAPADTLEAILGDFNESYYPGTAGSSLSAVVIAGRLMDWEARSHPSSEDIAAATAAVCATLDEEDAALLAGRMDGVYYAALALLGGTAEDVLDSAGYDAHAFPWSADDMRTLFGALYEGAELPLPE